MSAAKDDSGTADLERLRGEMESREFQDKLYMVANRDGLKIRPKVIERIRSAAKRGVRILDKKLSRVNQRSSVLYLSEIIDRRVSDGEIEDLIQEAVLRFRTGDLPWSPLAAPLHVFVLRSVARDLVNLARKHSREDLRRKPLESADEDDSCGRSATAGSEMHAPLAAATSAREKIQSRLEASLEIRQLRKYLEALVSDQTHRQCDRSPSDVLPRREQLFPLLPDFLDVCVERDAFNRNNIDREDIVTGLKGRGISVTENDVTYLRRLLHEEGVRFRSAEASDVELKQSTSSELQT